MKILLMFLVTMITFLGCQQPDQKDQQTVSEIKATVDSLITNWHAAAARADFEAYMGAMDSVSFYVATDATEHWTKEQFAAFSKPYFDKGRAWDFKTLERNIFVGKTAEVVWFDELLDTWMGPCRGSGVLEKSGDRWKIKHYVLSLTVPNDDIRAVLKAKVTNDSIFMQKFR